MVWERFPCYLPLVWEIHPSPVVSIRKASNFDFDDFFDVSLNRLLMVIWYAVTLISLGVMNQC